MGAALLTDHVGTPTELFAEEGKLAWRGQIEIWGHVSEQRAGIAEGDQTDNPWRYPGQYEDAETGLYYNRFRYYDPDAGRYISEDRSASSAGSRCTGMCMIHSGGLIRWVLGRQDGGGDSQYADFKD